LAYSDAGQPLRGFRGSPHFFWISQEKLGPKKMAQTEVCANANFQFLFLCADQTF
jgi:hypothetical protein